MASMRVHELAKELNITTKDINDTLGSEYKAVSGIGEEEIAKVRAKYGKSQSTPKAETSKSEPTKEAAKAPTVKDVPKAETKDVAKTEATKPVVKAETETKNSDDKKSHISQVFFPQNSSKGGRNDRPGTKNDGQVRDNRENRGDRDNRNGQGGFN
ncbi:MAG: translation initiation factor IF-2 N-terminal domain-containing protein, partial [Lachnospira sp.]|nr:translation initiation factor IF-2 N-terminal domain-containing protein [Lachnospira sp.]